MHDPCELCLNNLAGEYGVYCCARSVDLDEDDMARYLTRSTASCPFFEAGDEYNIVRKQN